MQTTGKKKTVHIYKYIRKQVQITKEFMPIMFSFSPFILICKAFYNGLRLWVKVRGFTLQLKHISKNIEHRKK